MQLLGAAKGSQNGLLRRPAISLPFGSFAHSKPTARLQSISIAAREINVSQPGLSQTIRALERLLHAQLFERRHSGCC